MRLSEFKRAVSDEFGSREGAALTKFLVLSELGDLTSEAALEAGVPAREVWIALCRANQVPEQRWYAVGLKPPPIA
ncbi:MAG: DUF3046 domain-containing protein [Microbacteriaceae bacterium]|nr:DUF3046 domain-containing protein [Cryobacterium sp.]MCC6376679.1 DUF3046 domain-containing protein [Microbacteriaceae bacterium]